MKGSYLAHAPRLGSVGLGAVFVCPLVGVLDAAARFRRSPFLCAVADRSVSPPVVLEFVAILSA
jgi:hypothetical protein